MVLTKKLKDSYNRNKLTLKTLLFLTVLSTAIIKVGDVGFEALENYMGSEEYRTKSWEKALEDPEFRLEVHQMYREHYGQPYKGFQTGTGR